MLRGAVTVVCAERQVLEYLMYTVFMTYAISVGEETEYWELYFHRWAMFVKAAEIVHRFYMCMHTHLISHHIVAIECFVVACCVEWRWCLDVFVSVFCGVNKWWPVRIADMETLYGCFCRRTEICFLGLVVYLKKIGWVFFPSLQ